MNKYKVLETKLKKISNHIDEMRLKDETTIKYLMQYKVYVDQLIDAVQKKTISDSNGAVLGLIKGISDYDELCMDNELWNLVTDTDIFYSEKCKSLKKTNNILLRR